VVGAVKEREAIIGDVKHVKSQIAPFAVIIVCVVAVTGTTVGDLLRNADAAIKELQLIVI
jgi:hypothetical protein